MKKLFTILTFSLCSMMAMADGTQSIKVAFNGTDNANWVVSSGGTCSVSNGLMNVTMAHQSNEKYRADLQCNTKDIYTMDRTKDVVWAVKLAKDIPGTANAKKFELQYVNAEGKTAWVNNIPSPSGNISTTDGGKIYYFNLGSDGRDKLSGMSVSSDNGIALTQIHFIFADATGADEYTYSVDWVATFASVSDLQANADMLDDASDVAVQGAIFNETQMKSYADLAAAVAAASANDVILVNESQKINSRLEIDKALTVKAGAEGVALTRGEKNTGLVVLMKTGGELTLEGIVLDGANISVNAQYLEAAAGTATLKDCVIKNNVSTNAKGSICSKAAGKIIIDGCSFTNNTASAENAGIVFNGASIALKGNVVFSGNTGNDLYLEKYVTAAKKEIGWEKPITLYYKNPAEDKIAIGGGAWEKGTTAFTVVNEGWYLYVKEGSKNGDVLLTQTKPTGIENIIIENGNNIMYNISGQRTGANTKGIIILNGKKYINR